jgi:transcriptional regulator
MYIPAHFAASAETVTELLLNHGAGDLVTLTEDGLLATMLPFLYEPAVPALYGHVARNNSQWSKQTIGESLAIVRGPDAYVSPAWYESKREHGRVVPTWNYVTVHFTGPLTVHRDPEWIRDVVTRLTRRHETGRPAPWAVTDAPPDYINGQLRGIVGVEMTIATVEAKHKLSQNRSADDQATVAAALRDEPGPGAAEISALMSAGE